MRMSMVYIFCVTAILYICEVKFSTAANINDTETLLNNLLQNYNTNVRPIYDQNAAIDVRIILYIKSIQEFDEVNERFSYVAALLLTWSDYKMKWDPANYGDLFQITVSYNDVWVPELTLSTPSEKIEPMGKSSDRIRFWADGAAEWFPANFIESTCSVNVRSFPFDTQSCTTSFSSLGYKNFEVTLTAAKPNIAFNVYSKNALWDVVGSEAGTLLLGGGGESEIFFTIKLKRKSSFVVINVLMPILVLSLLNVFVFVLVPESGERIGYCITTLLAIAVYMTIVSDTLPRTSEPVPLISYKLMVDVMTSALIVIVTILNMKLNNRGEDIPVPKCLQAVYKCLSCSRLKSGKIASMEDNVIIDVKSRYAPSNNKNENTRYIAKNKIGNEIKAMINDRFEEEVTWRKISTMVDWIALIAFTVISVGGFVVFILLTKN